MMDAHQRLTKKQKKAIAFRERKTSKGKKKDDTMDSTEDNDVPVLEDQDMADAHTAQTEIEEMVVKKKKKSGVDGIEHGAKHNKKTDRKAEGNSTEPVVEESKKRKRDLDVALEKAEGVKKLAKRRKTFDGAEGPSSEKIETEGGKTAAGQMKQRFILFVGNLKYTTSLDAIKTHFAACDPPPTIRLLTPKRSSSAKPTHKSKGCAFLEFSHRNALQQALKLHQSELEGRMINVELTAGGGGKSENRTRKLRERNKQLLGQRKERMEKQGQDGNITPTMPDRPQRYSATSGITQAPQTRRTWTVGEFDSEEKHRGGKKHPKKSKEGRSGGKAWGTGVNAIPVG